MRYMFRCKGKDCQHRWAVDYPIKKTFGIGYGHTRTEWQREARPGMQISQWYDAKCPKCGNIKVQCDRVKGEFREDIKCDERCTSAVGHICQCSCGGKNHGAAHTIEPQARP